MNSYAIKSCTGFLHSAAFNKYSPSQALTIKWAASIKEH